MSHLKPSSQAWKLHNGEYACRICACPHETLFKLKKHIYDNHSDYDCIAKYYVPVEKLVGAKYMDRFREQTYLKLTKETLDEFIEAALSKK